MLTRLCHAVLCCLFHPVINKAQNSVMGPVGPQSILIDGRGAANGSRCKPWPSFSPAWPSQHLLGTQTTKHLGILHLDNDVLYIIT